MSRTMGTPVLAEIRCKTRTLTGALKVVTPAAEPLAIQPTPHASYMEDLSEPFLLAEYAHLGDSFLRNEEDGEKRVQFFLTLVTASLGALGFLIKEAGMPKAHAIDRAEPLVVSTLVTLGVFGWATYLRIVRRNVAADRYKFALRAIRRHFVRRDVITGDLRNVFFGLRDQTPPSRRRVFPQGAGWLEIVALINALLLAALVLSLFPGTIANGLTTPAWISLLAAGIGPGA